MKATEQNFPVVRFIMLHTVVQTLESVNQILKCDDSSESYSSSNCGTVYCTVKGSNFRSVNVTKLFK